MTIDPDPDRQPGLVRVKVHGQGTKENKQQLKQIKYDQKQLHQTPQRPHRIGC